VGADLSRMRVEVQHGEHRLNRRTMRRPGSQCVRVLRRSPLVLDRISRSPAACLGRFAEARAERHVLVDGDLAQRQKSLNLAVLNCVYLVVCVIETCPSQSWIALVSMPSLASL
jgi:hypothetical protein